MQLCRLKQLFIVFEINFNAKHSHVCRLPAEEVVFRNASVSYSTLLLVFWNTKIGGNASATTFGVSEHLAFRTIRCIQTPKVVADAFPPLLVFRNTDFLQCIHIRRTGNRRCRIARRE